MKTKNLIKIVLILSVITISIFATKAVASNKNITVVTTTTIKHVENKVHKFSELNKPRALDVYWYLMAQCETKGNWKDTGKWSGGLGIYKQTWEGFGGKQFASTPAKATIEEQIIVANRISTQGFYKQDGSYKWPVGFNGWGCAKHIGKPMLFTKPPFKIYFWKFPMGERSQRVRILQNLIGLKYTDGLYGPQTKRVHDKFMKKYAKVLIEEHKKYTE